ncbi:MAG TPA: ABC transporter ATP-binding protein, partial [Chloroflexota bacterium]|nr:ABC transporter ATP-binding protein [Chloroflexota bacterium]
MAAITLQGVTRALSGGPWEAPRTGSERGVRRGTTTFAEDLPEPAPGGATPGSAESPAPSGRALDGVDLEVRDGETLAIIGPSGCGKSTLLRVVAGLEPVDSGRVLYDGQDVSAVPPGERGIGMVFQNYALYPHMESRGNLGFFLRLRRRREEEIDERVRLTAEIMGLGFDELLERKPGTLSGGQQQRVAIGRCIARDPRLILLDEPLSSLDARLRARTRVELKRLLTRFRITTIYVTHDQTEALALATRIAVMRRGRIEQAGTWDELYQRPASAFVAGFVGTPGSPPANLLPGTVSGGRARLAAGELSLPPALRGLPEGEKVLLAVRPEHLVVTPEADPGGAEAEGEQEDGALWGVVEAVEPLIAERAQLV